MEEVTSRVLNDVPRAERPDPIALQFLLCRHDVTGRGDLRDAIELALDRALAELSRLEDAADRAEWLAVFAGAGAQSESPAFRQAVARLVRRVRGDWRGPTAARDAMRSIGACLSAIHLCNARALAPAAIDELERIVGAAYRPGGGMAARREAPEGPRGGLDDQMAAASTLLTAHALTGRLPYAMLADELMLVARRVWWDDPQGVFADGFAANCGAAAVLCRLAALHAEGGYRAAAVVAADADYARDAARTLAAVRTMVDTGGAGGAARFGLALHELLRLA